MEKERYSDFKAPDFLLDDDFVAWLKGDDPAADADWKQWLAENPAARVEVGKARLMWQSLAFRSRTVGEEVLDEAWQKLHEQVAQGTPTVDVDPEEEGTPTRVWRIWPWLAAASMLVTAGVWVAKAYFSSPQMPQMAQTQTTNGQWLTITLTDGTTVRLNAGSVLTYPQAFPADKREVQLKGEAYFEVAPNAAAPFMIRTGDVDVQVIGTKFSVKAYPESEQVKVAVVEGKVAVQTAEIAAKPAGDKVVLTKDEMATVEKSNGKLNVTSYDKNDALGWQNGILYIEKADFSQIMSQLERWYGVEISVDENVKIDAAWRFSGKFDNKSVDYILDVCRYPNLFVYQVSGKKVTIRTH